jgi:hypothetical protein
MAQEVNQWRADHLMLAAKRLEIYIARLQKQAEEYRDLARKALAQSNGERG